MKKLLQDMAEEIARGLVQEMGSYRPVAKPASTGIVDLLLPRIAQEVVRQLDSMNSSASSYNEDLEDRLLELGRRRKRQGSRFSDAFASPDEDAFPNPGDAKAKYKNVESFMNYLESAESEGGIKLVIMNFND